MTAIDELHLKFPDAICIVSSDIDFLPVLNRYQEEGLGAYQCDFKSCLPEGHKAKKIAKELKEHAFEKWFIGVDISPTSWDRVGLECPIGDEKAAAIKKEINEIWERHSREYSKYMDEVHRQSEEEQLQEMMLQGAVAHPAWEVVDGKPRRLKDVETKADTLEKLAEWYHWGEYRG